MVNYQGIGIEGSKYKIGQKVRCINQGLKGAGWIQSREFIIKRITNSGMADPFVYWDNPTGAGVFQDSLILADIEWDE